MLFRSSLTNFPQIGQPLPGIGVRFFGNSQPPDPSTPSNLSCVGSPLTDQLGNVSCDLTIGCVAGTVPRTDNAYVVIGEYRFFPIRINVTQGSATKFIQLSGDAQTGRPGTVLNALSATLTDNCGNPIVNAPITWKVTAGNATLSNIVSTSNSLGGTSARVTLGQTPGTVTVQVSSGAAVATFTLTTQAVIGADRKSTRLNSSHT